MIAFGGDLLFGVVSTAVGSVALFEGFRELGRAVDSEEWPQVPGEIEETGVVTDPTGRSVAYAPEVRYHFRVGDRQYVSDRIAFGGTVSVSFRSWAEGIVERYRKSKSVTVRFCPTDPDLCVLEPGVHWSSWFILLVGAVFLAFGLSALLRFVGVFGA